MTSCKHTRTTSGESQGYSASVAVHPYTDENPAAHGCVTFTEECCFCGARRRVNQNQRHVEVGPWGETTAARGERAQLERTRANEKKASAERAIASVKPLTLTHKSGRTATVSLDSDGMLLVEGAAWADIKNAVSRSAWLEEAKAARQAVLEARLETV